MGTHTHLGPSRSQVLSVSPPTSRGISSSSSSSTTANMSAYSHDNRVKYVVRYLYDIDNNGVLDKNDFKCLAVRNTIVETNGDFPSERFAQNAKIMDDLWNEIALLADFDKNGDGSVGLDEFRQDVITRGAYMDIAEIDDAFNAMVNDADKAAGGITLDRYKELYAQFLGSKDETSAKYLFGPLKEL